ncbi:type II secretion system protein GspM (plasmid) [Aminobacter sp. BA135]|uniref:type II secretion system protein GspM n=1 Tax=Aminobacter sp. BA135 TaxID=537596 RepID=UPI003D7ABB0D
MTLAAQILNAPQATRRGLAIAIAMLVVGLTVWALVQAFATLENARDQITQKRETLGQLQAVVALAQTLQEAQLPASGTAEANEFLVGESDAVIRSNLQSRLNSAASANSVIVLSAGNAPMIMEAGVSYIGIRGSISGPLEGIHNTVLALESSLPVLFIREATLRSTVPGPQAPNAAAPDLFAEVLFYGAVRANTQPAEGAAQP